jgi:SPX domain protein involved in polyphosphate accumulation
MSEMIDSGRAIEILDNAYKSKEVVNISELGKLNQVGFQKIVQLSDQAKSGDQAAWSILKQWLEIGKTLQVQNVSVGV